MRLLSKIFSKLTPCRTSYVGREYHQSRRHIAVASPHDTFLVRFYDVPLPHIPTTRAREEITLSKLPTQLAGSASAGLGIPNSQPRVILRTLRRSSCALRIASSAVLLRTSPQRWPEDKTRPRFGQPVSPTISQQSTPPSLINPIRVRPPLGAVRCVLSSLSLFPRLLLETARPVFSSDPFLERR